MKQTINEGAEVARILKELASRIDDMKSLIRFQRELSRKDGFLDLTLIRSRLAPKELPTGIELWRRIKRREKWEIRAIVALGILTAVYAFLSVRRFGL